VALAQHLIHDYCIYHCCTHLNLICLCIILDPSWVSYHMLLLLSSLARLSPLTVSPFLCPDQTSSNKLGLYDVSPPFLWDRTRVQEERTAFSLDFIVLKHHTSIVDSSIFFISITANMLLLSINLNLCPPFLRGFMEAHPSIL